MLLLSMPRFRASFASDEICITEGKSASGLPKSEEGNLAVRLAT